jgi:hypothetical protein
MTPQDAWKTAIADQNNSYAHKLHAMLKIQDSVYLGEGESAVLTGRKGDAASWRWKRTGRGALAVSLKSGKLAVLKDGKPADGITKSVIIDADVDVAGQPTQVRARVNGWRLFVYNQQAPAAKTFTGVSYYPYDPALRVTARFTPDAKLPARVFRTSRGTDKQFFHAGDGHFTVEGKAVSLPFYTDSNNAKTITIMSAFFTDGLTGKGAYGAGRYVDVAGFGKFPPATVTIDFNQAYNPNCARSPHFTCPYAIDALPIAMRAGERDPHGAMH